MILFLTLAQYKDDHITYYVYTPVVQYKVSTSVIDLVVVFALFVFMLVLLCFFVLLPFFSANKGLCKGLLEAHELN